MAKGTSKEIQRPPALKQTLSDGVVDPVPPVDHTVVIALADELRISVNRVHKLYCIVLEKLSREARIRDYLPILVTKKVRNLIWKRLEIQKRISLTDSWGTNGKSEIR